MAPTVGKAARPGGLRLQHVALNVSNLSACERFYVDILGLRVVWRPDTESVYLPSGADNLALHQAPVGPPAIPQRLDHIGFALESEAAVDAWHDSLAARGVPIVAAMPSRPAAPAWRRVPQRRPTAVPSPRPCWLTWTKLAATLAPAWWW